GGPPSGSTITMLLGSKTVLLPLVIRYTAPMPVQLTAKPGTVASDSMLGTASNVYVSLFGLLVSKKSRVSLPPPLSVNGPARLPRYWVVGVTWKQLPPVPPLIVRWVPESRASMS